jgi:hypothetical protein
VIVLFGAFVLVSLADGTNGESSLSVTLETFGGIVLIVGGLLGIVAALRRGA